jgi:glutamyl-tRNA reductase
MPGSSNSAKEFLRRLQVAVIGCNHRTAPVELRERVAFNPEQALKAADELRRHRILDEAVVVSTCNRSELYGVSGESAETATGAMEGFFADFHKLAPADLDGRIYRQTGTEAVRHLFRVTSGLDSMLLGEAEILGQVRDAYGRALEHGSTGPVLNRLFQSALEVGKRVRAETEVGARPMSVAFAGVKLAERVFGKLKSRKALIVGAGSVAEQVIDHLCNRGIQGLRVVNRSREHAEVLARRFGGEAADWSTLERALEYPDIIVTSVGEAGAVLSRSLLEKAIEMRSGRPVFIVDLGVPRNVEPEAAELYNVYLYNVDDLGEIVEQNKKAREAEIPRAEAIIGEHIAKFDAWRGGMEASAFVGRLRDSLGTRREDFVRARLDEMPQLSPQDREALVRMTEDLLDHFLEVPAARLKKSRDLHERLRHMEALRRLFGMDEDDL